MGPGSGSRFATRSTSTCSPGPDGEANEAGIVNHLYARSVFFVKDAERSLRFYSETLGFSLDWKYEEQGRAFVLQVSLLGFELILNQTGPQTEDRADRKPRNVELMRLLHRLTPDFKTIADFRHDHPAA